VDSHARAQGRPHRLRTGDGPLSYRLRGGFDVNAMPLDAIWNSEWYRALRLRLVRREFVDRCGVCPYVFGSAANQTSSLRVGVEHSQAARFRAGIAGERDGTRRRVARGDPQGDFAKPLNCA
jgi:hypothetical protein